MCACMCGEHPLSRWVSWKGVGEVGRGQMDCRGKFRRDTESVRKWRGREAEKGEGGDG